MDLKFFNENGYYIEENVFSDNECTKYIEASKSLERPDLAVRFRPVLMPHRINDIYLEPMRHPKILASIAQIIHGKPMGLQTEFFYCKPGTHGFSLHQDNFYVEAKPPEAFVSAWCPLTDTYAENGGLIIYPGTHKEGALPVRKVSVAEGDGQDPNANNEETVVPSQYKPVNVQVPKGAVLYIHSCLVHGSNTNRSEKWRYVLLNTYIREGITSFRPGNSAKREPIAL